MPKRTTPLARALIACSFAACATRPSAGDGGAPDGPLTDAALGDAAVLDAGSVDAACARVARENLDGQPVQVCLEAFATPPYVHLPADSESTVYGGIVHGSSLDAVFRTRSGDLDVSTATWRMGETAPPRYGYLLYRAARVGGELRDVAPVVRIDDAVFQRFLAGRVIEGRVSARTEVDGEVRFEFGAELSLPLRIRLDPEPDPGDLEGLAGWPRHALFGTVENATSAVRGADGSCLASLASFGTRNPLTDATDARVFLLRHPNMHGVGDDVFTLDWPRGVTSANNMGGGLFIPAADLILSRAVTFSEADSAPHGTPWGGPSMQGGFVESGGERCSD